MSDSPDITELLETIQDQKELLAVIVRYLEHPDVTAIPFARNSKHVAEKVRRIINQSESVISRT